MRLGVMAEAFSAQLEAVQFQAVSFEDRFAMLVDAEWSARKSNRLTRLIRNAGYADPAAYVENIELPAGAQTGSGANPASGLFCLPSGSTQCHHSGPHRSRQNLPGLCSWYGSQPQFLLRGHIHLPDLLVEISVARSDGTYRDYMKKLKKEKLLIQDEWLLYPLKETEAQDVLELAEARNKVVSTIFCSQYDTSEWHETLHAPTLADAICDRIYLQHLYHLNRG